MMEDIMKKVKPAQGIDRTKETTEKLKKTKDRMSYPEGILRKPNLDNMYKSEVPPAKGIDRTNGSYQKYQRT